MSGKTICMFFVSDYIIDDKNANARSDCAK
jgi:hypothetical protein